MLFQESSSSDRVTGIERLRLIDNCLEFGIIVLDARERAAIRPQPEDYKYCKDAGPLGVLLPAKHPSLSQARRAHPEYSRLLSRTHEPKHDGNLTAGLAVWIQEHIHGVTPSFPSPGSRVPSPGSQ
jgi:hypothetical protein